MKKQILGIIIITFCSLFFFVILPTISVQQITESLQKTNVPVFILAIIIILISNTFGAVRWSLLMNIIKAPLAKKILHSFGVFSIGQVAGLIVPSRIGNYSKVPMINKLDNIPYKTGLAAVNAETVLDLGYIGFAGLVSLSILFSFFLTEKIETLFLVSALIIFFFTMVVGFFYFDLIRDNIKKSRYIGEHQQQNRFFLLINIAIEKLFDLIISTREIFTDNRTTVSLVLSTVSFNLIAIVGYYCVIRSLDVNLPLSVFFAIMSISFIVGIISMIPGGFGASDLSLLFLLVSQGVPPASATSIIVLFRIAMYFPIFVVIGFYTISQRSLFANR